MLFYLLVCLLYTEAQSMEHVVRLLSQGHVLQHQQMLHGHEWPSHDAGGQYVSGQKTAFLQLRNTE